MKYLGGSLPTHLDFTTLYAAALALNNDVRKRDGLPLSRLLSLSQLIESIVLHESLQYELGSTIDWVPYREAIENSIISRLPLEFGVPLLPADDQVDSDEPFLLESVKSAVEAVKTTPLDLLFWAVQLRSGTYASLPKVSDLKNPVTERYLELARSVNDSIFQEHLTDSLSLLNDNDIGILGFHVLVCLMLHESYWVNSGRANYYPHFSRQPLLASLRTSSASIEKWTMSELSNARDKIIKRVDSEQAIDPLACSLSPIFIACLAKAKRPEDIIDEANRLRNSEATIDYRNERDKVMAAYVAGDSSILTQYKVRLSVRLSDLRDLLFERGSDVTYERQSVFKLLPGISFGLTRAIKKSKRIARFPGDLAAVFLGDVVLQSLGVIQSADKIRDVFGTSSVYDTRVLGIRP